MGVGAGAVHAAVPGSPQRSAAWGATRLSSCAPHGSSRGEAPEQSSRLMAKIAELNSFLGLSLRPSKGWRLGWGRSPAQISPPSSAAKHPELFRVSVTFSPRMTATVSREGLWIGAALGAVAWACLLEGRGMGNIWWRRKASGRKGLSLGGLWVFAVAPLTRPRSGQIYQASLRRARTSPPEPRSRRPRARAADLPRSLF